MYKLLTEEEKERVEAEYRARRARAALTLGSLLILFAIVALSPTLIFAMSKRNAAILALNSSGPTVDTEEAKSLASWAMNLRAELAMLSPSASSRAPYESITSAIARKPASVRLTSFTYAKSSHSLVVKGNAPDRDTLLTFQSALVASGDFTKADFPVNNLAKDSNIDFELDLTLSP